MESQRDIVAPVRGVFDMPADMYEASLGRVYDYTKNCSLVILSVFRSADECTPEENEAAHAQMRRMVQEHGFGYGIPVRGRRTIENRGQPNERAVDEKWLLVTAGSETHERLIAMAKHIGRHFDQSSVLFKPHTDENVYLLGTTKRGFVDPPFGKTKLVGKFHPNKVGDFMTLLKRHRRGGHTFAFGESIAPEDSMKVVFLRQRTFFSRNNTPGYDDRIF